MRYKIGRVLSMCVCAFLFSAACLAQGNLHVSEPAIRIQLLAASTGVELPVENAGRSTVAANVVLELVDPQNTVQSRISDEASLLPGRTVLHLSFPQILAQHPFSDPKDLLWYRLRYSVSARGLPGSAREESRGIISVSQAAPALFELHVAAPEMVKGGSRSTIRVRAIHPVTLHPVEGVTVQGSIDLDADPDKPLLTPEARTDAEGFATLKFLLPARIDAEDEDELEVKVTGKLGNQSEEATGELHINHFSSVLLSTDKPMYQPGQTLHVRLMAFDQDHKAVAKRAVTIKILDPENSLMFRSTPETSRFGVASADWPIPENLRLGDYQVTATIGEERPRDPGRSAFVKISRYDLPAFSVGVKPDRAFYLPGQNAEIEVRADYLFGQPVQRGYVRVAQETEREWNFREQKWEIKEASDYEGDTDGQGRYLAHLDLSAEQRELSGRDYERFRDITFAAYFTDASTGRTEQRRFDVRITKEPIHVYVIPGQGSRPGGLPLEFYLSTDYADGAPVQCEVEIGWTDSNSQRISDLPPVPQFLRRVRTNRYGVAKVTGLAVPAQLVPGQWDLNFRARDQKGQVGAHSETQWSGARDDLRVATNKTLYAPSDPIYVELSSSEQETMVVVEAVHESQVIASRIVHMRRGQANVIFPSSPAFQNKVTIVAFGLGAAGDDAVDPLIGDRTVYFPKDHELKIDIRASKPSYRPGEEASATLHVTSSEGGEKETAVGLVVLDKAVEERARSDRDFSGNAGFFHFRDGWQENDELNGVRIRDLDKLDLTRPLPDGLELVADALLQMSGASANLFTSDLHDGNLLTIFAGEISPALQPVRDALNQRYQQKQEYPRTEATLKDELAGAGTRLENILDPWGTPFRARFGTTREMDTLEIVSAGPDKKFGTEDDFVAAKKDWPYFKPFSEAIQRSVDEFHARTGGYIRDLETLKTEVARQGNDIDSLKDRWDHAYRYEFGVRQTSFTITVMSAGPDGRFRSDLRFSGDDFPVSTSATDYFAETLAKIDLALNKTFKETQAFPENTDQLAKSLQASGISWSDLRDPWGHPYYATFRQDSIYADRIDVQTYENYIAGSGRRVELVPVTRQINFVYLSSAGEDGIEGTSDDFLAGAFSRALFERSSRNPGPQAIANPTVYSGSSGAVAGTVTDLTGGVIAGAKVTAINGATNASFETTADVAGSYILRNLPAGFYLVHFTSLGFRETTITSVPVRSSTVTKLDVILNVGETTETVTVTESVPTAETTSSAIAAIVPKQKTSLPPLQAMTPRLREYFPETLYWQPELITDGRGHARLKFPLADNITTWRLSAIASTESGEIGTVEKEIRAFQPFFVEHDPPKFLTVGDEIDLPVVLRNFLDRDFSMTAELKSENWFTPLGPTSVKASVPARDNTSEVFKFRAISPIKNGKQRITATGADSGDSIERTVSVRPDGEERVDMISRMFGASAGVDIRIPGEALPGSVEGMLKIYPNLNAHVLESIEAILKRPYGCAEQTISSAYPSLLLLQYAKDSPGAAPDEVARARRYVQLGRDRLAAYESTGGGITYWGRGEPDAALTAYGLKFMSEAREFVGADDLLAQQNLNWLLRNVQPDGRWVASSWSGLEDLRRTAILTAYVARILATAKIPMPTPDEDARVSQEVSIAVAHALDYLEPQVNAYDEPYLIASYALASFAAGQKTRAEQSVERLRKLERREGNTSYWSLETNTLFYGWGLAGRVETTALVLRALQAASNTGSETDPLESRGLLFLLQNQDRLGIWYSTQATINVLDTLRSLTSPESPSASGVAAKSKRKATILVDGRQVLAVDLPAPGELAPPLLVDLSRFISVGSHHLEITRDADSAPASLQVLADYYVPWAHTATPEETQHEDQSSDTLRLRVEYDKRAVKPGEEVRCEVEAERIGFRGYGMLLAEIGLPPGAEVNRSSLEAAVTQSGWEINHYDVLPDRVVVYLWPHAGGAKFFFTFRPRFGLRAQTPPSILYDYYNPEAHAVVEPAEFRVGR